MPKLIAVKAHTYNNRTIQAGEEYEAAEPYATTLVSLGRATRQGESTQVKPTTLKQERKEEPKPKEEQPKAQPAKAEPSYKTRRLRAKDE